jgi:hypothetical protein
MRVEYSRARGDWPATCKSMIREIDMKNVLTAAGLVAGLLSVGGITARAQAQADARKYDKGSTVTLQGCVVAAEKKDTFVLTNVNEWPIAASDMGKYGKRMYWIEKTDKLKSHAGHTIQVVARITDVEKSEMEYKDGGFKVEIEGPGRDVVTPAANAGVSTDKRPNQDDIAITLLKLKVDEVKMISPTCSSTRQ